MSTQCPFTYYQCTPGSKGDHILMYLSPLLYFFYIYNIYLVLQLLGTKALFGTFVFPTEPKPTWIWDCLWILGDQSLFWRKSSWRRHLWSSQNLLWEEFAWSSRSDRIAPPTSEWHRGKKFSPPHLSYSESVIPPWLSWKCSTLASPTLTPKGKNDMPRSHNTTNTFRLAN